MTARAGVVQGDCREVMARLPEASIAAIVTDPPYGLSFMGKGWDHAVPGVDFWAAALRVAKPGAHLVAFGGTRTYHRLTCAIEDAGWEIRDCLSWLYGSGFPKSHNGEHGGTALKPGWEPIILARRPLAGTVAANYSAHGTGGLNVDGCRIEAPAGDRESYGLDHGAGAGLGYRGLDGRTPYQRPPAGRWPANVALDADAAAALDEQSGPSGAHGGGLNRGAMGYRGAPPQIAAGVVGYGDTGGASRFFYCAKASRKERGATNDHPTVKPLELMRWLVRLVAPAGGVVLDPFAGSGSTLLAAVAENRDAMGIELDAHHVQIIRDRLGAA